MILFVSIHLMSRPARFKIRAFNGMYKINLAYLLKKLNNIVKLFTLSDRVTRTHICFEFILKAKDAFIYCKIGKERGGGILRMMSAS
jgi:predicted membrane chloride channel (bestrophin family)